MNRLLSILVSLFVLFLIYLWINHIMTSTPRSEIENQTSARLIGEDEQDDLLQKYDITENETPDPEPGTDDQADPPTADDTTGANEDLATAHADTTREVAEQTPEAAESPSEDRPPATTTSTSERPDGIHMVIAGNFLERANADRRARHLRENGFANAEVVNFQLSQYHTVCAARYNDLAEARRMAKKLQDYHSIDAYVRNGN